MDKEANTKQLDINSLVDFANHPFKLYEGKRFNDMVESIKANGIIVPIVARPVADGKHEILSGHNRVRAAKEAGLGSVPAIVREGLSDDEALLIVTETNLLQRSFADMSHSERAAVIAVHYGAIKGRGYRSDLIDEVEQMIGEVSQNETHPKSLRGLERVYGLSKNTIARYLRLNKLIPALKRKLDEKQVTLTEAVELSYLRINEQEDVDSLLMSIGYEISFDKACELRKLSAGHPLSIKEIEQLLFAEGASVKKKSYRLSEDLIAKHFTEENSREDVEAVLEKALQLWFDHQEENTGS